MAALYPECDATASQPASFECAAHFLTLCYYFQFPLTAVRWSECERVYWRCLSQSPRRMTRKYVEEPSGSFDYSFAVNELSCWFPRH